VITCNIYGKQVHQLFSLYRSAEFWKWRYVDSPGFSYLFFGEPQNVGIVVARIEKVYCPERKDIHQLKVLRIIEVFPFDARVWNGRQLDDMVGLIMGVLSWAKEQGCCALDFQCSTRRLDELLFKVEFKLQGFDYLPGICSLAGLFQPFKLKPSPINALWKINYPNGEKQNVDPFDTYIVKSDNDMDRTNFWPVFE